MNRVFKRPEALAELAEQTCLPAGRGDESRAMPESVAPIKKKNPNFFKLGFHKERRRHTLPHNCSTICAGGLNFSVRDGKR